VKRYKHIVIGAGMTADAAVRGIREIDANAEIGVFGREPHAPYNRPPLSKGLWKGKPLKSIWRRTEDVGVDLHLSDSIEAVDPVRKVVTDHSGASYAYDRLLLATGGVPRRLPLSDQGVVYFRTLDDYERLRALSGRGARFAVIGGGFIGSEIAAALAMNGERVNLLFPEPGIGGRMYPEALSTFLNGYYHEHGVTVRAGETLSTLERVGDRFTLGFKGGGSLDADAVVAGIGIETDVTLAKSMGLKVDNGIVVDETLRTTQPDVFAAGDVANFYNPALGMRVRVEHEDNANTMGAMAGRNMAGHTERYEHLPYFYSDLFDLGYEAVGELRSDLEVVEDWKEPFRKGVLYYLRGGRVRGVLLWNTWGQVEAARKLIATADNVTRDALIGRISD
jgi:3-phenylpropionate/trans-cinnamate dioxygenase ferredoxin reductase subunit